MEINKCILLACQRFQRLTPHDVRLHSTLSSSSDVFAGMAPLHRPEFDARRISKKVFGMTFGEKVKMVKPDIAVLKERVRESVLSYDNTKERVAKIYTGRKRKR